MTSHECRVISRLCSQTHNLHRYQSGDKFSLSTIRDVHSTSPVGKHSKFTFPTPAQSLVLMATQRTNCFGNENDNCVTIYADSSVAHEKRIFSNWMRMWEWKTAWNLFRNLIFNSQDSFHSKRHEHEKEIVLVWTRIQMLQCAHLIPLSLSSW